MYRNPFFVILFTIIIILSAVLLLHRPLLKWTVAKGAEEFLGLHMKMAAISVRLSESDLQIKGLTISGPEGFENQRMIAADTVYVDFDWGSVFNGETRFERIFVVIPEATVVRNASGKVNFEEVKRGIQRRSSAGKHSSDSGAKGGGDEGPVIVKLASLRLGKVEYKDYTGGDTPFTQTFPVPVSEIILQNATWEDLDAGLDALATVGKTGPGPLIKAFSGGVRGTTKGIKGIIKDVGDRLE